MSTRSFNRVHVSSSPLCAYILSSLPSQHLILEFQTSEQRTGFHILHVGSYSCGVIYLQAVVVPILINSLAEYSVVSLHWGHEGVGA